MISEKKVLSCAAELYGHSIPALALGLALQTKGGHLKMISFETRMEQLFQRYGVETIKVSVPPAERGSELKSILQEYEPEITICDWCRSLWFALTAWRPRCRVSILRCELLPGYQRRNLFLPDKFGLDHADLIDSTNEVIRQLGGLPLVKDRRELFAAEIIAVPSIPQIDPLPEELTEFYPSASFVYTGPLLLSALGAVPDYLKEWLLSRRKEGLTILLVTLGTHWGGSRSYAMLADCLARTDLAIVMIVPQDEIRRSLDQRSGPRFQVTHLTDLLELTQYADVVMHHCGHATLQTVLLAGKPSVTLPTGEYDREDNALRLEDLDCGRHLGHDFFRKGLNADAISGVVKEVLADARIAEGIKVISQIIHGYREHGVIEFVHLIERRLDL